MEKSHITLKYLDEFISVSVTGIEFVSMIHTDIFWVYHFQLEVLRHKPTEIQNDKTLNFEEFFLVLNMYRCLG